MKLLFKLSFISAYFLFTSILLSQNFSIGQINLSFNNDENTIIKKLSKFYEIEKKIVDDKYFTLRVYNDSGDFAFLHFFYWKTINSEVINSSLIQANVVWKSVSDKGDFLYSFINLLKSEKLVDFSPKMTISTKYEPSNKIEILDFEISEFRSIRLIWLDNNVNSIATIYNKDYKEFSSYSENVGYIYYTVFNDYMGYFGDNRGVIFDRSNSEEEAENKLVEYMLLYLDNDKEISCDIIRIEDFKDYK